MAIDLNDVLYREALELALKLLEKLGFTPHERVRAMGLPRRTKISDTLEALMRIEPRIGQQRCLTVYVIFDLQDKLFDGNTAHMRKWLLIRHRLLHNKSVKSLMLTPSAVRELSRAIRFLREQKPTKKETKH